MSQRVAGHVRTQRLAVRRPHHARKHHVRNHHVLVPHRVGPRDHLAATLNRRVHPLGQRLSVTVSVGPRRPLRVRL